MGKNSRGQKISEKGRIVEKGARKKGGDEERRKERGREER